MKKTLTFLGAGIVIGAVAYAVWHKMNKGNQSVENDFESKNNNSDSATFTPTTVNNVATEYDIDVIKSTVDQNMATRHEEAAQIIKDAVDVICKRSEVDEDENKELEQISNELDTLLEEE